MARRGHRTGAVRRRRLRALREGAERVRLRHVATRYNYDEGEDHGVHEVTLRAGADTVAGDLRDELQQRVQLAACGSRRRS